MAKKKKTEKPPREFTRRQLSQFQRQRRRQRIIFGSGIFIIAAVVLIVLIGWYLGEYRPMHQTAIRVNDTEFDMGYYIDTLRISEQESVDAIQGIAISAIREIEMNELIRQEALKLGITVGDDEVEEMEQDLDGVTLGEAESAYSTTQFISNVIVEQQKKVKARKLKKQKEPEK